MKLTPSQRRVLEWLYAWPGVQLSGDVSYIGWTAAWASPEARGEAAMFASVMGVDLRFASKPDPRLIDWPTPACRRGTFRSLLRSGYLVATGQHRTIPFYRWYTISAEGVAAIERDRAAGIELEPEPARIPSVPTKRCECGYLGYTLKGHPEGERHQTWLAVRAYSARVRAENEALRCSSV